MGKVGHIIQLQWSPTVILPIKRLKHYNIIFQALGLGLKKMCNQDYWLIWRSGHKKKSRKFFPAGKKLFTRSMVKRVFQHLSDNGFRYGAVRAWRG